MLGFFMIFMGSQMYVVIKYKTRMFCTKKGHLTQYIDKVFINTILSVYFQLHWIFMIEPYKIWTLKFPLHLIWEGTPGLIMGSLLYTLS